MITERVNQWQNFQSTKVTHLQSVLVVWGSLSHQFLTQIMTFYWKFVDTLVKNIATIAAIFVGVSQFLIRAFNENDGVNKVRKFINQTLFLVNRSTSIVYGLVNANTLPLQEVKVTKSRKRSAS